MVDIMGSGHTISNSRHSTFERRLMDKELKQGLLVRRTGKWRCICGFHSHSKKSLFFNSNKIRFSIRLMRRHVQKLKHQ